MSTKFGKAPLIGAHRAPYKDLPGQLLQRDIRTYIRSKQHARGHYQMSTWSVQLSEVDHLQIAYLTPSISNVPLPAFGLEYLTDTQSVICGGAALGDAVAVSVDPDNHRVTRTERIHGDWPHCSADPAEFTVSEQLSLPRTVHRNDLTRERVGLEPPMRRPAGQGRYDDTVPDRRTAATPDNSGFGQQCARPF